MNRDTLDEWIKCAFNGNILVLKPMNSKKAKERWEKTVAIEGIVNNKNEIMRKLHRVKYEDIFG